MDALTCDDYGEPVVSLQCVTQPARSARRPASVTLNGTSASTAVVTLQTSASASITAEGSNISFAFLVFPTLFGIGLSFTRFRRRGVQLLSFALLALLVTVSGCNDPNNPYAPTTPSTPTTGSSTDNLTISASSAGNSPAPKTVNWSVIVTVGPTK